MTKIIIYAKIKGAIEKFVYKRRKIEMKKITLLICALLAVCFAFALTSCECKHEYGEWTVAKAADCASVGEETRTCTKCQGTEKREIPVLTDGTHSFGEWVEVTKPTCSAEGRQEKVCSLCSKKEIAIIPALVDGGHSFGEWSVTVEPSCSAEGKKERVCSLCTEKETVIVAALEEGGHSFGEWAISVEPTCTSEGQRVRYCLDCDFLNIEKLSALDEGGHSYGEWQTVTEPSCSSVGSKTRECAYCDHTENGEIPALTSGGHSFGEWTTTVEPTCSTEGEQKRVCSLCGGTDVQSVSALDEGGHSFDSWKETIKPTCDTLGQKTRKCILCGDEETEDVDRLPIVYTIKLTVDGEESIVNLPEDGIYTLIAPTKIGYSFAGWLEGDREFPSSGIVTESKEISAKFDILETKTFNELKTRIDGGTDKILLANDIVLTDTIYVTGDTTIYTEGNYTLTREASFLGELFVLGEDNLGNNLILKNKFPSLSIKGENGGTLTIDGNKDSLTDKVKGTVFFITNGATLNIYDGVTVQNHKKLGNELIFDDKYAFGESELVGGSVALINDGTFNMYGGTIKNNEVNPYYSGFVNEEDKIDGYKNGSYGGAIYNLGVVNMYGGSFENNLASYGGVIYNARELNIEGGIIANNIATAYGGVVFSANTGSAITYLGSSEGDITENKIFFNGNCAKGGGVIYLNYSSSMVIYGNTVFDSNKAEVSYDGKESIGLNGGAICTYGELVIYHAEFKNNEARYYGGGVYAAYTSEDKVPRVTDIKSAIFEGNEAKGGGAIMASKTTVTLDNVNAVGNNATTKGGGFAYLSGGAVLEISGGTIKESACNGASGGAFYISGSKLNLIGTEESRISILENTTDGNGGVICAYIQVDEIVTGQDSDGNDIIEKKSTRSTVNISYVDFKNNTSTTKANPGGGGVIYASNSDITVDNAIFELNSAVSSGVVALYSSATFTGDVISFINNTADSNGGVMYTSGATVELSNVTVTDNSAKGYINVTETTNEDTGETEITEEFVLGKGGAFYFNSNSTFTGTNIVATGNSAGNGGFMYSSYSNIVISGDSAFIKNTATSEESQHGGGAFYLSDCTGSIENAEISENTAANGGAIAIFKSKDDTFKLVGCTFDKNTVSATGGTFYVNTSNLSIEGCTVTGSNSKDNGGVIYSTTSTVDISKSTFEKNSSTSGLIYLTKSTFTSTDDKYLENSSKYGTYYVNSSSSLTVNNCVMTANTANFGACIYLKSGSIAVNGLESKDNVSTKGNGGAINIAGGEATITNATFTGNKATYDSSDCYGGAISVNGGATVTMTDVSFVGNQAAKGGAIGLVSGTLTINGITANGNTATGYTDGTAKKGGNGGAIYVGTGAFTLNKGVEITENTLTGNVAQSAGGGIYCFETNTDITIDQITLTDNEAIGNYGGGLYIRGKATTGDNTITVNIGTVTATGNHGANGGAAYLYRLESAEIGSLIASNNTATNGGAVYIAGGAIVDIGELSGSGNSATTNGGFAYIGTSTTKIHSGTVGENDDVNGRELYFSAKVSINTEKFTYPEGGINDASKISAITE